MLTREEIESEGWLYTGRSIDIWFEKSGELDRATWNSYKATLHYNLNDYWLVINIDDTGEDHRIFEGKCHNIEEFKLICKLVCI